MLAILVTIRTVMRNSLHPVSAFTIIARRLLDFVVQEKITGRDTLTILLDATPFGLSVSPPPSSPHSYATLCRNNNNNNDRLTAFDPGQPG